MLTECPHCQTLFRISQEQIDQADGNVRCCRCREVFNARKQPQKSLGTTDRSSTSIQPETDTKNDIESPGEQESEPSKQLFEIDPRPSPDEPKAPLFSSIEKERESTADFELLLGQQSEKPDKPSTITWSLLSFLALAALLSQLAWLERHLLVQYPGGEKLLNTLCLPLGCTVPPLKNTHKIEVVSRNFSVHPNIKSALQLHMTIISKTHFDQVYPQLQLNLFNTNGLLLASRIFEPIEYLPESWQQYTSLMPAHQEIDILMELVDPGEDVTGFKLEFL